MANAEDILQAACWQELWQLHPETRRCCWHVPNGGDRRIIQAKQLQAMGVLAGVHDIHLFWATRLYIIEFKVGANQLSDAQKKYGLAMVAQGAVFYECRDIEKWRAIYRGILSERPIQNDHHLLLL